MTSINDIIEIIDSDDDDTLLDSAKEGLNFFPLKPNEKDSMDNRTISRRGKRQRDKENKSKPKGDDKDLQEKNVDNNNDDDADDDDDDDDDEVIIIDAPPKKIDEVKKCEVKNNVLASKTKKKNKNYDKRQEKKIKNKWSNEWWW